MNTGNWLKWIKFYLLIHLAEKPVDKLKGNAAQDNNNNNKESHSPLRMVFC